MTRPVHVSCTEAAGQRAAGVAEGSQDSPVQDACSVHLPYAEPVSCRPSSKTAGLDGWPPAASVHRENLKKPNELEPEATRPLPQPGPCNLDRVLPLTLPLPAGLSQAWLRPDVRGLPAVKGQARPPSPLLCDGDCLPHTHCAPPCRDPCSSTPGLSGWLGHSSPALCFLSLYTPSCLRSLANTTAAGC